MGPRVGQPGRGTRPQSDAPSDALGPALAAIVALLLVASLAAAVVVSREAEVAATSSPAVAWDYAPGEADRLPDTDRGHGVDAGSEPPPLPEAPDETDEAVDAGATQPADAEVAPSEGAPAVPRADDGEPAPAPAPAPADAPEDGSVTAPSPGEGGRDASSMSEHAAEPPADEGPPEDGAATGSPDDQPATDESASVFAREFPAQAAATQRDGDPASFGWAVIVGVNRYAGRTSNTLGSVADAHVLREVLLRHGWKDDHILVLADHAATHDGIVRAIEWLARSTDERSTVVFSFSGHLRHRNGVTALWPSDNRYIWNTDLGRMLGAVRAQRMWVSLQGCHAAGLRAPGVEGPGRVVTYSSKVEEKSYEDPEVGHSVQGYYLFVEGLRDRWGNPEGQVSVQEAWQWAAPRAHTRTAGRQTPVIVDGLGTPLHLHL